MNLHDGPLDWISPAAVLFFALIALVLVLMYLLFRSRIVINLSYTGGEGENEKFDLRMSALGGFVRFRLKGPVLRIGPWTTNLKRDRTKGRPSGQMPGEKPEQKRPGALAKANVVLHEIRGMTDWARQSFGNVRITLWNWDTEVGTGDAVSTAMATGAAWSAQTTTIGILSQLVQLTKPPNMTVRPLFSGQTHFSTVWSCIAEIRLGHAILAGLRLMARIRSVRGGLAALQNIRSRA